MDDLRAKVRALHTSGMDADMVVDLIIDVVARGLGKLGGRPPRTGMGPTATSIETGPAQAPPAPAATQSSIKFDVSEPVPEDGKTSNSDVCSESGSVALVLSPSGPPTRSSGNRRSNEPLPPGFADFWSMAPRRVCKLDAIKAWEKGRREGWLAPLDVIMTALVWQTEEWDRTDTPENKRPHPATWINGRRWENERPAPRAPQVSKRDEAWSRSVKGPYGD